MTDTFLVRRHNFMLIMTLLFVMFIFPIGVFPSLIISNLISQKEIVTSVFEASILASAFYYTFVLIQWPIGLLLDRYGAIIILRISIILSIIGLIIFYLSNNFFVAVLSRILNGLAGGAAIPVALFIAHHGFDEAKFLILAGVVEFLAMSSSGLSQLVLSKYVTVEGDEWRSLVLLFTVVGILLSFFYFLFIRGTHKVFHQFENEPDNLKRKFCYSQHVLINGVISGLIFSLVNAFYGFWCIHYLSEYGYHLNKVLAASYSCIGFLGAGISAPLFGYFIKTSAMQYRTLMLGSVLVIVFTFLIGSELIPISVLPIVLFLTGVCSGVYVIPYSFVNSNCPKHVVGTTLAIVNILCGCIGSLIIIPLIGFLIDTKYGFGFSLESVIYFFPLTFLFALFLILFYKKILMEY